MIECDCDNDEIEKVMRTAHWVVTEIRAAIRALRIQISFAFAVGGKDGCLIPKDAKHATSLWLMISWG
jgi:hypothetical protein